MDIRKLQRAIVDGLEDVKAQDITVFNTEHLSPLFERVVIATANSARQTKALASSVREAVRSAGFPVPRSEGEENGEWIIVDCGPAVAHVMQPDIRSYYHLEEIWGEKPVRLKLGGDAPHARKPTAKKPSSSDGERAPAVKAKSTARKTPARKTAAAAKKAPPAGAAESVVKASRKTAAGKSKDAAGPVAKKAAAPRKKAAGGQSGTKAKAGVSA